MCSCLTAGGKRCQGAECWANVPTEEVTFNLDNVSLPLEVILPLPVANQAQSTRRIAFTETTMVLPTVIVDWIRHHGQYHVWLAA
jgi:hypothetical protein